MVREGEKPRRELADCRSVDVMKGARGLRVAALSSISFINQDDCFPTARILSVSVFSVGSLLQVTMRGAPSFVLVCAVITQYVTGVKARISRSRSMMMRRAGDWTRPADRPW